MNKSTYWRQLFWLSYRYLLISSRDLLSLFIMFAQALVIGYLCSIMWEPTSGGGLSTILVMSAVWLGFLGSCREVVKERIVFERERLFGLSCHAYIMSKFLVLSLFSFIQMLLLVSTIETAFSLLGDFVVKVCILWLIALTGNALGILVSVIANRQDFAVISVPLLVIPQLLFLEGVLPEQAHNDFTARLKHIMPSYWGESLFNTLGKVEFVWFKDIVLPISVLITFCFFCIVIAGFILQNHRRLIR